MNDMSNDMPTDQTEQQLSKRERREIRRDEKEQDRRQHQRVQKLRRFLIWSIAVVFLGGTVFGLYKVVKSVPSSSEALTLAVPVNEKDWSKGNANAPATLVEYSDFQCPACAAYFPFVQQLQKDFGPSKLRVIYRHFPLRSIHPRAQLAAQAAEAAGKQGKFWEMHDLLFQNQKVWAAETDPTNTFVGYATSLKLGAEQFKRDLKDQSIIDEVESDYISGVQARVNSTPTFFLNGVQTKSPNSYDEFKQFIEQAIAQPQ